MSKSQAIMTYVQIFNPGDKYLKPTLKANRVYLDCTLVVKLRNLVVAGQQILHHSAMR